MSRSLVLLALAVLLSCLLPFTAAAQDDEGEDGYATTGPYLSLGVGAGNFPLLAEHLEGDSTDSYSMKLAPVIDGRFGYRAISRIAWELEAQYFFNGSLEAGKSKSANIAALAMTTNVKGYVWTGDFQPYALLGFGVLSVRVHKNDPQIDGENRVGIGLRGGLGVEYYFSETIGVDLGVHWLHGEGRVRHFDTVDGTANLILRF